MSRGRPSLADNPYADRILIRNFLDKYGEENFLKFLKLGSDVKITRSKLARDMEVNFGSISKLYDAVFDYRDDDVPIVRDEVKEFVNKFYGLVLD